MDGEKSKPKKNQWINAENVGNLQHSSDFLMENGRKSSDFFMDTLWIKIIIQMKDWPDTFFLNVQYPDVTKMLGSSPNQNP